MGIFVLSCIIQATYLCCGVEMIYWFTGVPIDPSKPSLFKCKDFLCKNNLYTLIILQGYILCKILWLWEGVMAAGGKTEKCRFRAENIYLKNGQGKREKIA